MLILTRNLGETIMIGDDIAVTVLSVFGTHVRVSITAPKETSVHREETHEHIERDQEQQRSTP